MVPCFETEKLNVTFWPSPNSLAFVNGIEVVSMPKNMYVKHQDNSVSFVNSNIPFDIPDATAFETVYSLNVGGGTVANVNDTGMFRTWLDDKPCIFGAAWGITPTRPDVTIKYSKDTPAYTAPAVVYTTSRTMGRDLYINMNYNLTWNFDIDGGFNYLLRLYFCETLLEVTEAYQRVFDIFINNRTAEKDANVIYWSGSNSIPVYKDYVVLIPNEGQNKQILWLALHPSRSQFVYAILNGLEIFRLNKSDGSLAVPNPQPSSSLASRKPGNKQQEEGQKESTSYEDYHWSYPGMRSYCIALPSTFHDFSKERRKASPFPDQLCQCFTLAEIQAATNDFDDAFVIGGGGFGNVYKGFISRIKFEVAIKRLNSLSQQGAREFWSEIQLLSQLRYVNLVSLIGYCNDNKEMILRLKIFISAARGLDYLHSRAIHQIIHRDVKSTNILLDEQYVAKISDFSLSKMSPISMTNVPLTTVVRGTFGYMDLEYYKRVRLAEKSDVYSFGVVLFEVLFARLAVDSKVEYSQISLADWGRKCVANESINESIDPFLKGKISPSYLRIFSNIAENCIPENGCERLSMNDVAKRLELALQMQEIEDVEQIC
ncbi:receptor-like protein kinase FERONIA isoform X2 [Gossypium australe]|uniref:Receptor-like protein kinase FERONIA isoform X2 n=1 Tax=Gossypium australe TaxID=47621 RepID=A0A5B6UM81_9ROSI|nr:receptor-like protein kinase FERONIA isoform X2 [Gossypium australe]